MTLPTLAFKTLSWGTCSRFPLRALYFPALLRTAAHHPVCFICHAEQPWGDHDWKAPRARVDMVLAVPPLAPVASCLTPLVAVPLLSGPTGSHIISHKEIEETEQKDIVPEGAVQSDDPPGGDPWDRASLGPWYGQFVCPPFIGHWTVPSGLVCLWDGAR
jgi:hypothetical protein